MEKRSLNSQLFSLSVSMQLYKPFCWLVGLSVDWLVTESKNRVIRNEADLELEAISGTIESG